MTSIRVKLCAYPAVVALLAITIPFATAYVLSEPPELLTTPASPVGPQAPTQPFCAATPPAVVLSITPTRSRTLANGEERLELEVDMATTRGGAATMSVAHYLVDALGNAVSEVKQAPPRVIEPQDALREVAHVAGSLPNGVYQLRTLGAAIGDFDEPGVDTPVELTASAFIRVAEGYVTPIEFAEWYQASNRARVAKELENPVVISVEPITPELEERYAEYLREQARDEERGP